MTVSMVTRKFDLVAAKKGRFLIQSMGEDNGHSGIRRCSVLEKTSHKWLYQIFDMLTYYNEKTICDLWNECLSVNVWSFCNKLNF